MHHVVKIKFLRDFFSFLLITLLDASLAYFPTLCIYMCFCLLACLLLMLMMMSGLKWDVVILLYFYCMMCCMFMLISLILTKHCGQFLISITTYTHAYKSGDFSCLFALPLDSVESNSISNIVTIYACTTQKQLINPRVLCYKIRIIKFAIFFSSHFLSLPLLWCHRVES